MGQRLDLHQIFKDIDGVLGVYFQPPANVEMKYPAIVYNRDFVDTEFAGNKPYKHAKRYLVTVIDKNPDSGIPDKVLDIPTCVFVRHFTADGLNHDVHQLYF